MSLKRTQGLNGLISIYTVYGPDLDVSHTSMQSMFLTIRVNYCLPYSRNSSKADDIVAKARKNVNSYPTTM